MIGSSVGNYQIVSQIGLGGMGAVYLARHAMLGRPAAVKVLLPEMSSNREVVERFFNEARAATSIRSPSIVEVYDFGYLPAGSAYLIMELLEGESLCTRLQRVQRLPWQAVSVLARQIAGALQAAHAQGIVHRDLKPENVFVVRDPEVPSGERIKLLDFGIAKVSAAAGEGTKTRTGAAIGTPTFMAPEQCRDAGRVDARADLYALGCLLYVLLCGRPPFVADGPGDVMAHHLYFPPDPLRAHEPSVPEGVERLVLWLLQKAPEARPQSAATVIAAIDALGSGSGVEDLLPPLSKLQAEAASSSAPPARPITGETKAAAAGPTPRAAPAMEETLYIRSGAVSTAPRRSPLYLAAAAAVIVGGGVVVVIAKAQREPVAPSAPLAAAQAAPPAPRPQAPNTPATAPEPPRQVLLQFTVQPAQAKYQIRVDGKAIESTAVEVPLSRTRRVEVEVTAQGYQPYTATPLPVSDLMLSVQLQPVGKSRPTLPGKPPEASPTPPAETKPKRPPPATFGDL